MAIAQVNDFKASAKSDAIPLFVESKKMETCSIETACTIGERKYMEDRFLSAVIPFKANGHEHTAEVCAVFDGHGGLKTVQFAVSELLSILKSKLNRFEKKELNEDDIFYALKEAIGHLHKAVIKNQFSDGTTLVLSFKVGDQLWVANVGDSSAFINRNGEVIPMSIAQKPALIKDSQGKAVYNEYAKQLMCNGVSRCLPKSKKNPEVDELSEKEADALQSGERMFMTISDGDDKRIHCMLGAMMEGGNITLDMARSIGDPFFAPWKKFTPEIFRQTIKPGDQLILHSDGVAVGMHAVAKTIEADKKDGISAWETVANIVQASVPEGDNITAMIVTFSKVTGDKTENIN